MLRLTGFRPSSSRLNKLIHCLQYTSLPAASSSADGNAVRDETRELLDKLDTMIKEVRSTTKTKEKVSIVERQDFQVKNFLNAFIRFALEGSLHVTSHSIQKYEKQVIPPVIPPKPRDFSLESLLEALSERKLTGHSALETIHELMSRYPERKGLLMSIFDAKLGMGMGTVLIKEALSERNAYFAHNPGRAIQLSNVDKEDRPAYFPRTSKDLPVALGVSLQKIGNYFEKTAGSTWLISRKLDGIRCLAHYIPGLDGGEPELKLYTRAGNELTHLHRVKRDLYEWGYHISQSHPMIGEFYIDGELCVVGESSHRQPQTSSQGHENALSEGSMIEDFRAALGIVLKKPRSSVIQYDNLYFFAFDLVPSGPQTESPLILSQRINILRESLRDLGWDDSRRVRILDQFVTKNPEDFKSLVDARWEGLIIRRDCEHLPKRSYHLLILFVMMIVVLLL